MTGVLTEGQLCAPRCCRCHFILTGCRRCTPHPAGGMGPLRKDQSFAQRPELGARAGVAVFPPEPAFSSASRCLHTDLVQAALLGLREGGYHLRLSPLSTPRCFLCFGTRGYQSLATMGSSSVSRGILGKSSVLVGAVWGVSPVSYFLSQASPPPRPLGWLGSSLSHWPESSQAGEGRWPDEWLKQLLQDTRGLNSITFLSGRREKHQAGGNSWRPGAGRGGNIVVLLETIYVKGESDLCGLI